MLTFDRPTDIAEHSNDINTLPDKRCIEFTAQNIQMVQGNRRPTAVESKAAQGARARARGCGKPYCFNRLLHNALPPIFGQHYLPEPHARIGLPH
jgi:hypothetical protein